MTFNRSSLKAGRDLGLWPVLLLLPLAVLVAAATVLWFMNAAIENAGVAARQKLAAAYQGQLELLRDRLESEWQRRAARFDEQLKGRTPSEAFQSIVANGLADSAICLGDAIVPGYPQPVRLGGDVERGLEWAPARKLEFEQGRPAEAAVVYEEIARKTANRDESARAMQAAVRCLLRANRRGEAMALIDRYFLSGPLVRGLDAQGRSIAVDEQLLRLHLSADSGPAAEVLRRELGDYKFDLPASQRLFAMGQAGNANFPTFEAERLARQVLDAGVPGHASPGLRPTTAQGTWVLDSDSGSVLGIYRTATLMALFRKLTPGGQFELLLPGAASTHGGNMVTAGGHMPGWRIELLPQNASPFDPVARRTREVYLGIGAAAVLVLLALGAITGEIYRAQLRLARLKTDLVAAVSHELKTPLASMRVLVDSLLDDARPDAGKVREYLELISRENVRLSRMIENFLTFSRIERQRQSFDFAEVRPAEVLESAREALQTRIGTADCELRLEVAPALPAIKADEDALVTVLVNLLENAYRYTPGKKRIRLSAETAGEELLIDVEDNGIGIAQREQRKIFQRFYQVERKLTQHAGGCGLGLSIVDYIVRAHGGTVEVRSELGKGSRFRVHLPLQPNGIGA